jgi:hypothetical protein
LTTTAETESKQTQTPNEKAYFASLFTVDGKLEGVRRIHRGKVRQRTKEFADKLLSGEVRAFYLGVEGGE